MANRTTWFSWRWTLLLGSSILATFLSADTCALADDPPADAAAAESSAATTAEPAAAEGGEKYTLRYKFRPGELMRWRVMHRAKVDTTISGTSQVAETTTTSVKVWRLLPGASADQFKFENSVESIEMRQKLSGREEVHYDSTKDQEIPPGFKDAAESVGVPLSIVTIDARGQVIKREDKRAGGGDAQGQITLPLPEEPIAVGHVWSYPYDIQVTVKTGEMKQIKTRQRFTLESVANNVASINVETQILSPVSDRAIEAQLVQRQLAGTVRFDIKAGRILGQQMDLDKNVVGFSGESSSLHYVTRFTEELLPPTQQAAAARPAPAQAARKPGKAPTGGNRPKTSKKQQPTRRR
jgi:hypothetical protein